MNPAFKTEEERSDVDFNKPELTAFLLSLPFFVEEKSTLALANLK